MSGLVECAAVALWGDAAAATACYQAQTWQSGILAAAVFLAACIAATCWGHWLRRRGGGDA